MTAEPWGACPGPRRDVAINIVAVQGGMLPSFGCPGPIKNGEHWVVVAHAIIPALKRQRQVDLCEFRGQAGLQGLAPGQLGLLHRETLS